MASRNSSIHDREALVSSTSEDTHDSEILIEDNVQPHSVSTVLNYCKTKILNPYFRFLSIMGLRPIIADNHETNLVFDIINYIYIFQITTFMILGYWLQYMSCFRRDRGFAHKFSENLLLEQQIYRETCHESVFFTFIAPSVLHLYGYFNALAVFRRTDDDQLPVLIERVFLSSSNLSSSVMNQKKLVKALWFFVIFSGIWMILSLTTVNYMMAIENINFKWMENSPPWAIVVLKMLLVIGTMWQDIVQATVIASYCLQAQLLSFYIEFLREKLMQTHPSPLSWIRDIEEFRKLLNYFNRRISLPVCIFTIVNLSCAIAGLWWLMKFDLITMEPSSILVVSVANIILWIVISIVPFIQAARLTSTCEHFKTVGQEVRTRPYVHQDTPTQSLNSILTYTMALNLSAKLFCVPIHKSYLCFVFTFLTVLMLVLGQSHYII